MKNFVLLVVALCLVGFTSQSNAQDQVVVTRQKTVTFKCIKPVDVVKGIGCYVGDVGKDILKGTKRIISAPFKARMCIPKARLYKWERGYWVPSKLYELPDLDIRGGNMQYLPYYDHGDLTAGFIAMSY